MKYFYVCDRKCECSIRADGKRNEFCGDQCLHTSDIEHALYKEEPRVFVDMGHDLAFEHVKYSTRRKEEKK